MAFVTKPTKTDRFSDNFQGGRGVIFNPKIYIADFGNLKQDFLSMKLIQKSTFRVQGMFFFFNNCIEKINTRHTLKKTLLNHPPLSENSSVWRRPQPTHGTSSQYQYCSLDLVI